MKDGFPYLQDGVQVAEEAGWVFEVEVELGSQPVSIWTRGRRRSVTKDSYPQYLKLVTKKLHADIKHQMEALALGILHYISPSLLQDWGYEESR